MLRTFLKNYRTTKFGFTLVEIVVVIGIMGLLSAIVYSSFDASRAQSRDQKRVSDISTIQLALEQYFQKYGLYPVDLSYLVSGNPDVSTTERIKYLSEIPTPPLSSDTIYQNNYFPITKMQGTNKCISYQLWTRFEKNNSYLDSKRGFDSDPISDSSNLYECIEIGINHDSAKINALKTPDNDLVYDVMP